MSSLKWGIEIGFLVLKWSQDFKAWAAHPQHAPPPPFHVDGGQLQVRCCCDHGSRLWTLFLICCQQSQTSYKENMICNYTYCLCLFGTRPRFKDGNLECKSLRAVKLAFVCDQ